MSGLRISLLVGSMAFVWSPPSSADACSDVSCKAPRVLPINGSLPANATELLYQRRGHFNLDAGAPPVPHLYEVSGDGGLSRELPLSLGPPSIDGTVRVTPRDPLAAGTLLQFEAPGSCATPATTVRSNILVTASAPRPSNLGHLTAELHRERLVVPGTSTACSSSIPASYAEVKVELSAAAKPYADILRYELRVDGQAYDSYARVIDFWLDHPYGNVTALPRGTDRVFLLCDPIYTNRIAEGSHRVRMVGVLPDGTQVESDEVSVTLSCEGVMPDALRDAGVGPHGGDADGDDDDGCAVAAPGSTRTAGGPWVMLVVGLMAALCRRGLWRGSRNSADRLSQSVRSSVCDASGEGKTC